MINGWVFYSGGVLEPEGTVEIKYRQPDLLKTIHRLDAVVRGLDAKIANDSIDAAARAEAITELREREEFLLPLYHTVAVQFADLHDTTGRMLAKNVIAVCCRVVDISGWLIWACLQAEIPWKEARCRFYWRLRRRLIEDTIMSDIDKYTDSNNVDDALVSARLERLFNTSSNDQQVCSF